MSSLKARQRGRASTETLADLAYFEIRSRILKGSYPLGAALSRRALAVELGMSFLPVSEALQRLEHDGLVESRPRAGTRVRVPAMEEIRERYQLREALETQSARLFTVTATKVEKVEIRRLAKRLDKLYAHYLASPGDSEAHLTFQTEHMAFHSHIAELSRCYLLKVALEREQVLIYNALLDVASGQRSLPPDFHAELAEALASGDVETADQAMRRHVNFGFPSVVEGLKPGHARRWRLAGKPSAVKA
jgi:GntR family transcriptional regulator, rspAB operon transcriptional repressor